MKINQRLAALVCAAAAVFTQALPVTALDTEVTEVPDTGITEEHIHSYTGVVTKEATCAEEGEMVYSCECGDSYVETIPKATSHKYGVGEVITEAACGVEGKVVYTCKICGRSYTETIPALSHQLDEGVVSKNATCTEKGIVTYTCTLCGSTFDRELPVDADAHEWGEGEVTKLPSCKESGITTYTCTLCGTTKEEEIPRTEDHQWNEGEVTTQPTCGKAGVKTFTCEVCGLKRTEEIPATGNHYFGKAEVIKEADCTHAGLKHYVCSGCGLEIDTVVPKSAAHKFDSGKVTKEATLTEKGSITYTCTLCGKKLTKTLPKLKDISKMSISLASNNFTYDGKAKTPDVTVKDGTKVLTKGTDYTLSYTSNTNTGTGYVTIKGKGSYASSVKKAFTITAADLSGAVLSGVEKSYTYTGKGITPAVKVTLLSRTLGLGSEYTVSFTSNKAIGTAKVTVKGTGNFKGSKSVSFKIIPKKTDISKLTSTKAGRITVKWNKNSTVTGYQIVYSNDSKFASKKTATVTGAKTVSKTIKGLASGKNCYVKIRCYKTVGGTKYYSGYSAVRSIKVK